MQRFLSTGLVLVLLVATAIAFVITENLKLTQSPITRTQVSKVLSPVCGCGTRAATIKFWLRRPDVLTLSVVDSGRHEVARLVDGVTAHARWNTFRWNGRTAAGRVAPDGVYFARAHLERAHRTIQLPNPIQLLTKPPKVLAATSNRTVFSPDGDGQSDSVKIHYTLAQKANALLFVRGRQVVRTRFAPRTGSLSWYGRVDGAALPAGVYRLEVGAVDAAGNVTPPQGRVAVTVRLRYIELARRRIAPVGTGMRFGVRVGTDATSYGWRLDGSAGRASSRLLVVRAPSVPGTYRLVVTENGHQDAATVVVVPR